MLGIRVSELRHSNGWSQVELGKRLGVAKQTVSNWENGNIQPSIEMLVRLAALFNVTTDYLLGLNHVLVLDVKGLPAHVVGHLSLLINDYRDAGKKCHEASDGLKYSDTR